MRILPVASGPRFRPSSQSRSATRLCRSATERPSSLMSLSVRQKELVASTWAHILAADEDETAATLIRHLNALAPQVGKRIADIGVAKSLIATFGSKVVEQLDDIDAVKRELSGLRTLPVIAATRYYTAIEPETYLPCCYSLSRVSVCDPRRSTVRASAAPFSSGFGRSAAHRIIFSLCSPHPVPSPLQTT